MDSMHSVGVSELQSLRRGQDPDEWTGEGTMCSTYLYFDVGQLSFEMPIGRETSVI